jgi:tetratricopeptide (TPR) repeat protein
MQTDIDKDLLAYFTDVEHLRNSFRNSVAAPTLVKRMLVIYGVGGVGKSSLLRMFRIHCKSIKIPIALASGDEQRAALDVLVRWAEDLKVDSVVLSSFAKTVEHYRSLTVKVEERAKKAHDLSSRVGDIGSKAVSKTAEVAGGALAGAALGSIIPGIGTAIGSTLGGVLGGMGTEALLDWLRGFLKQPDIDLLLDPTKKLTDDFLADIMRVANKKRIVIMLDALEQITALSDWVCYLAQRFPQNLLFVVAGRALPNWNRVWQDWMMQAHVEELKPMTEDMMRDLAHRYYFVVRDGQPSPSQIQAIIRFARGLPIAVTTAVQLWVKYGVEDFQFVKTEIIANLVDRLIEGVPKELVPALEASATVRWFDQPILRELMKQDDVRNEYNELRRFPFVRTRAEGLALHNAVRELIDENLRLQDSERHRELHERAVSYFDARFEKVPGTIHGVFGEEAVRLELERIYHRIRVDEEAGIKLLKERVDESSSFRLINRLRTLLNDANTYPLEHNNSKLWRKYFNARLAHLEARLSDAEEEYRAIGDNELAEPKLRAYALCDLGEILSMEQRLLQSHGIERAIKTLEHSQRLMSSQTDVKVIFCYHHLKAVYTFGSEWGKAIEVLEQALQFFQINNISYGIAQTLLLMKSIYAATGNWKKAVECTAKGLEQFQDGFHNPFLESRLKGFNSWNLLWSGRFAEAEQCIREALGLARQSGDNQILPSLLADMGFALGFQGKYDEAKDCFIESVQWYEQPYSEWSSDKKGLLGFWGSVLVRANNLKEAHALLIQSLSMKREAQDYGGIPEVANWLGQLEECRGNYAMSESYYNEAIKLRWVGRRYWENGALTGLVRVKYMQNDFVAILPLLTESEQLAQQLEYNDYLAFLRLTQGHLAFDSKIPEWSNGFEAALHYYQEALIYSLRYNRFLLDEVLFGRQQGKFFLSVTTFCMSRGQDGRRILIALRDWWKKGNNDVGMPRSDTISPLPEGISLLEAEQIARRREPGNGSPQKSVVDQIEKVLEDPNTG